MYICKRMYLCVAYSSIFYAHICIQVPYVEITCKYIYVYTHTLNIYIYLYLHIHICMFIRHIYKYTCWYQIWRSHICIYIYTYTHIHVHIFTHIYTHVQTYIYCIYTYACRCPIWRLCSSRSIAVCLVPTGFLNFGLFLCLCLTIYICIYIMYIYIYICMH